MRFSDGLRQLYVPKLNTVSASSLGLRSWLTSADDFIPSPFGIDDNFEIALYNYNDILMFLSSDISRLACASIETVNSIKSSQTNKHFLAWQLIEYYYSAFYAAHCTLKICGLGLTQVNNNMIRNIQKRARTLGLPQITASSGIYCTFFDHVASKVVFFKASQYNDNHQGMWCRYADFLSVLDGSSISTNNFGSDCIRKRLTSEPYPLSVYSQLPLPEAQSIVNVLAQIKQSLNQSGNNNWLSMMRNQINYNNSFGVWYPYHEYKSKYDSINGLNALYKVDPLSSVFTQISCDELCHFVIVCQLINAINYEIIQDLTQRHPENKSFLKNGPLSYTSKYCS